MTPLFSVIIPTYNRAHLIGAALESVLAQSEPSYEIIVVDDGSTDETARVVAGYGERIQYVRQSNAGPGAARNAGIARATGKYVAFLDSDDVWFPWTLDVYRQVISRYGSPSFLSGSFVHFRDERELEAVQQSEVKVQSYSEYYEAARLGVWVGSGVAAIKRSVLHELRGFSEMRINAEDHDLSLRLGMHAGFALIREPVLVGVRWHAQNVTNDLQKTVQGIRFLLDQEAAGRYPGGTARAAARRYIIAQHTRGATQGILNNGLIREALSLYWSTLPWQIRFARWRYIIGFPLLCLSRQFRRTDRRGHFFPLSTKSSSNATSPL